MADIINIAGLIKPSLPTQDFYRIMIVYVYVYAYRIQKHVLIAPPVANR